MKIAKRIDEEVSMDLDLSFTAIPMIVRHVSKLHMLITGLVFAYVKDDVVHYDTVTITRKANGFRIRIPKFITAGVVLDRLEKHEYQRWYARCNNRLYPLQMIKPKELMDMFYFIVDDDPRYKTKCVYVGDTQFIRKKPLVECRLLKPTWGDPLPIKERKNTA